MCRDNSILEADNSCSDLSYIQIKTKIKMNRCKNNDSKVGTKKNYIIYSYSPSCYHLLVLSNLVVVHCTHYLHTNPKQTVEKKYDQCYLVNKILINHYYIF